MRAAPLLVGLAACGFEHGNLGGAGDAGAPDGSTDGDGSIPVCGWSFTPTNFDPCELPAPAPLVVSGDQTLNTNTTQLPKKTYVQGDGTAITVIHLSEFRVEALRTLTVNGTGAVFAVAGPVRIDGIIVAVGGADDPTHCGAGSGANGADSTNGNGGGGGGGGGAAAENGGIGGAGNGTQAGAGGPRGTGVASTMTPLRGGCGGGNGGRRDSTGSFPQGGRGGGALQISSTQELFVYGRIDASGRGGGGAPGPQIGGGGGGSGGAIFLEAPTVDLGFASVLCADGGSGGEGGGAGVPGNNGQNGACTGAFAAETPNTTNSYGGDGGDGSFALDRVGGPGQSGVAGGAGGGGGGGGVGWIRIKTPNFDDHGAVITPGETN